MGDGVSIITLPISGSVLAVLGVAGIIHSALTFWALLASRALSLWWRVGLSYCYASLILWPAVQLLNTPRGLAYDASHRGAQITALAGGILVLWSAILYLIAVCNTFIAITTHTSRKHK